jgi:hypothetical protein
MKEKRSFREKQRLVEKHRLKMDIAWAMHRAEVCNRTDHLIEHDDLNKLLYYLIEKGILDDETE